MISARIVLYSVKQQEFPKSFGKVLSNNWTLKRAACINDGHCKTDPIYQTSVDVMMYWIFCNVYTVTKKKQSKKRVQKLFDDYTKLKE